MTLSQDHKASLNQRKSGQTVLWLLIPATALIFLLDLFLGSVTIPLNKIVSILLGYSSGKEAWDNIILMIRLPKGLTALFAGSALSTGGLLMQTLFRNPLAGPSVLGISAGASLGVAILMLGSGWLSGLLAVSATGVSGSWMVVLASTTGAAFVLLIILALSLRIRDNIVLLVVGIMVGQISIAVVSIGQYFAAPEEIQDYLIWTFGSLGGVTRVQLGVMAVVILPALFLAFIASKPLNMLLMGENYARSMGLNIFPARFFIIFITAILAGTVTGFCGPIGFIGIAVPHLVRSILNTADHRWLLPASMLAGAMLMLLCDIIAGIPGSTTTFPINAVTSLIGAPVVIWVILRNRNLKAAF